MDEQAGAQCQLVPRPMEGEHAKGVRAHEVTDSDHGHAPLRRELGCQDDRGRRRRRARERAVQPPSPSRAHSRHPARAAAAGLPVRRAPQRGRVPARLPRHAAAALRPARRAAREPRGLRPGEGRQVHDRVHVRPRPRAAAPDRRPLHGLRRGVAGRAARLPRRHARAPPGRDRVEPEADRHRLERQPARHRLPAGAGRSLPGRLRRRARARRPDSRSTRSPTAPCCGS